MWHRHFLIALAIAVYPAAAGAQNPPVIQSGNVTPGHVASWITTGVVGDGGAPGGFAFTGPTTLNDFTCVGATGTIIDCGLSATSINNWPAQQNFNGGATATGLTVSSSFTATGLVTNADLANPATTVNGQTCTLGSTCTVTAAATSITTASTIVNGGPGVLYNSSNGGTLISSTTLPSGLTLPSPIVTGAFTATGLVTNADLANPATTVNGQTCTLGSTCTVGNSAITAGSTIVNGGPGVLYNSSNGGTLISSTTLPSGLTTAGVFTINPNSANPAPNPVPSLLRIQSADGTQEAIQMDSFLNGNGGNLASYLLMRQAGGTAAAPTATPTGRELGVVIGRGYGTTGYSTADSGAIDFISCENWTDTSQCTLAFIGVTPIGTNTAIQGFRIDPSTTGQLQFLMGQAGAAETTVIALFGKTSGEPIIKAQDAAGNFTLTLGSGSANSTLTFGGNLTTSAAFTTTGAGAPTLAFPGSSFTYTFQGSSDTIVGRATTDTLTNKTFNSAGTGNTLQVSGVTVSAGQYPGTTTNDNAAAGNNGEYVSSSVVVGSALSLSNATAKDVTTISLTAGDWDVSGYTCFTGAASTNVTDIIGWVSTSANTLNLAVGQFDRISEFGTIFAGAQTPCVPIVPTRINLSTTTTVSLGAYSSFSISTVSIFGSISARRAR